ncbi:MAG TPA: ATP-binding protein [Humisphaera sp.]|nr:ATP-binding protein [Humisphaera sp.]
MRQLRISLAAKCQILFGAAVVLIIAAALAVPWNRMEQLTEQLNARSAGALAENALAEHVILQQAGAGGDLSTRPPATQPSSNDPVQNPPRLLSLAASERPNLDHFDKRALAHFKHEPDGPPYTAYYNSTSGYRFAQPVFILPNSTCIACHSSPSQAATRATTRASMMPLVIDPTSHLAGIVSVDISSRIQESQLLLNRVFILVAGTLAGALAIWSFYLITTRLILQPVRVLQETAEKVSQGDLNIRSDIQTGDEFQQLSETFNAMLGNLQESADQLRDINKGLDLKLGQLAEANLALYESNRLKSEFLANVSHELRTPLNSILGFADLLREAMDTSAEPKGARYINNILQSGRHLLDLINDLLDLAKIEAGKMEVRSEPLSLHDLFEGLGNILRPLIEARQLTLMVNSIPDVPIIMTDPGKLQQVLYNFLSNAIKFSPVSGRIDLAARREGVDQVRISVTDYGPGIAPEMQQVIFEKFRQVDASVTRTHGGTGLGLSISKELISLLGGTIGVDSSPGEGATFWITLPLRIEAGAMDVRGRMVMN